MGTDIHLYVEKRNTDGTWSAVKIPYNGVCSSVCEDGLYCSRGEEGPHWLHGRDAFDENSEDWQHTFYDSLDPKVRP